jgi:hypothetical protein
LCLLIRFPSQRQPSTPPPLTITLKERPPVGSLSFNFGQQTVRLDNDLFPRKIYNRQTIRGCDCQDITVHLNTQIHAVGEDAKYALFLC